MFWVGGADLHELRQDGHGGGVGHDDGLALGVQSCSAGTPRHLLILGGVQHLVLPAYPGMPAQQRS